MVGIVEMSVAASNPKVEALVNSVCAADLVRLDFPCASLPPRFRAGIVAAPAALKWSNVLRKKASSSPSMHLPLRARALRFEQEAVDRLGKVDIKDLDSMGQRGDHAYM